MVKRIWSGSSRGQKPKHSLRYFLIMPQINLSIEEHQSLTKFLSHPKAMTYRSDLYDTDTFASMEDKVFDAVNNLTLEDF